MRLQARPASSFSRDFTPFLRRQGHFLAPFLAFTCGGLFNEGVDLPGEQPRNPRQRRTRKTKQRIVPSKGCPITELSARRNAILTRTEPARLMARRPETLSCVRQLGTCPVDRASKLNPQFSSMDQRAGGSAAYRTIPDAFGCSTAKIDYEYPQPKQCGKRQGAEKQRGRAQHGVNTILKARQALRKPSYPGYARCGRGQEPGGQDVNKCHNTNCGMQNRNEATRTAPMKQEQPEGNPVDPQGAWASATFFGGGWCIQNRLCRGAIAGRDSKTAAGVWWVGKT